MTSYLEKKAKREEWMATWQFLRRSWQELPENRDEEPYMRPNCLVGRPKVTSFPANSTCLLSEQLIREKICPSPSRISAKN